MASFAPYTYIQCPCYDSTSQARASEDPQSPSSSSADAPDEEDHTFDPRAPRSSFSLYPLEHLLYCDVCQQIRCPRCIYEEIVNIYCPSCLFEVATSSLKTEGNRCTRSCFQCPICIGPLAVQSLDSATETSLLSAENAQPAGPTGPWILACSYCNWSSSEIGVKFDKPQGISAQLSKMRQGGTGEDHQSRQSGSGDDSPIKASDSAPETTKARFSALKSFYQSQLADANPNSGFSGIGDYGYNSPAALSRIMNIYSGNSLGNLKTKNKNNIMREANSPGEGLRVSDLDERSALTRLQREGYDGSATVDQVKSQVEEGARFGEDLWPIPYLLRSKRSKRCPVCRHIISKPESKVGNTRWRIRLVANNHIPSISVRPLIPSGVPGQPQQQPLLKPFQPTQFLVTFKNPIFDDVKVTLATPATTPGRFASKVTVLCPQFSIDANTDTDMYLDDVLKEGGGGGKADRDSRTGRGDHQDDASGGAGSQNQGEAGKVWERGRNWVSIVVEVIPAALRIEAPPALLRKEGDPEPDLSPLREDEDVLEIPMFVHLEWEGDPTQDQGVVGGGGSIGSGGGGGGGGGAGGGAPREKRELAYWCVLGVGRISQDLGAGGEEATT